MATAFKDYYATLGIQKGASPKEIKTAFRKLARKHHPDLNPKDAAAEARFKEVNEANEVLGDPAKRKKYDELGPQWAQHEAWERAGRPGQGPFGGGGGAPQYRSMSPEDMEEMFGDAAPFSDFFQSMFGGGGAAGGSRFPRPPARRGHDVEGQVEITLEEAAAGTVRTVQTAGASGPHRVEIKIPAGIRDGGRVRAAGQGTAGSGGSSSGDLYIRASVLPHAVFTRAGDDLRMKVPVPLEVALLGGDVEVPTITGKRISLHIPPETQNGKVLRLRGVGMPRLKGDDRGDLLAEVDVRLPIPLTPAARELAERLGTEKGGG